MISYIVELVTLHCTDTDNGKNVSIESIRKNHILRGFKDVGYHAIIQADGTLEQTRPLNVPGAHVEGHNARNVGIALAGCNKFTDRQFKTLRDYLRTIELCSGWKTWNLFAHHEFNKAKTCPNMRASDLVHWYLTKSEGPIEKYLL